MSDQSTSPLYPLLSQINAAAEGGLHLVAIGMAVTLPHLCSSLAIEGGRAQGKEYKAWCEANLTGSEFDYVAAEDLYSIRCGVLHQGRFGDLKHSVERVIFMPPGSSTYTNCKVGDAYFYGVVEFCRNLCDAAYRWYEANRDDPIVQENSMRMMRYHLGGLPPYVVAPMVIG